MTMESGYRWPKHPWSHRAVDAAIALDKIARRDDMRLAEVEVRGEVVDLRALFPDGSTPIASAAALLRRVGYRVTAPRARQRS